MGWGWGRLIIRLEIRLTMDYLGLGLLQRQGVWFYSLLIILIKSSSEALYLNGDKMVQLDNSGKWDVGGGWLVIESTILVP